MDSKKKNFIPKPEYSGGMKALSKFIEANLIYPEAAIKDKIQGMVSLRLEINYQGKVTLVKLLSGIREDCNEEAIRIAHLLIFNVSKVHNLKVIFFKNINIHFNLPLTIPQIPINYILTSTESVSPSNGNTTTYNYTIKI